MVIGLFSFIMNVVMSIYHWLVQYTFPRKNFVIIKLIKLHFPKVFIGILMQLFFLFSLTFSIKFIMTGTLSFDSLEKGKK